MKHRRKVALLAAVAASLATPAVANAYTISRDGSSYQRRSAGVYRWNHRAYMPRYSAGWALWIVRLPGWATRTNSVITYRGSWCKVRTSWLDNTHLGVATACSAGASVRWVTVRFS